MLLTRTPLCFSTISYRSVEIRDRRCWRRRTSHLTQSEWTVVGACVCRSSEGRKNLCRMLQKRASRKIHFKKRWFFTYMFVLRSVRTILGQICNCCTMCTYFPKASPPFRCQLQQRGLCICSKKHIMKLDNCMQLLTIHHKPKSLNTNGWRRWCRAFFTR